MIEAFYNSSYSWIGRIEWWEYSKWHSDIREAQLATMLEF